MDGYLQAYRGYYLANPGDFVEWNNDYQPTLPDLRVFTIGFNAHYIFDHEKFSYRAAFVRNEIQEKSAGSITAGLFGSYDKVSTNNGFIPSELRDSTTVEFDLKEFEALSLGITVGYMYTFVFPRRWFINLAGVPGVGYRRYYGADTQGNTDNVNTIAWQILLRMAVGYDHLNWYLNLTGSSIIRNYEYKSYEMDLSTENIRLTFGWRLGLGKSK
jgi:hypothetical protein